jgi:hypothetical protein
VGTGRHGRWAALVAGALLVATVLLVNPGAAQAAPPRYRLMGQHSGLCVEVAGGSLAQDARIDQATCSLHPKQVWIFNYLGMGHYQLQSQNSGKCLDVAGTSADWGAPLVQRTCGPVVTQSWLVGRQPNTDQNFWWDLRTSASMCMDVAGDSLAVGAPVNQWGCHGGSNQIFHLNPVINVD